MSVLVGSLNSGDQLIFQVTLYRKRNVKRAKLPDKNSWDTTSETRLWGSFTPLSPPRLSIANVPAPSYKPTRRGAGEAEGPTNVSRSVGRVGYFWPCSHHGVRPSYENFSPWFSLILYVQLWAININIFVSILFQFITCILAVWNAWYIYNLPYLGFLKWNNFIWPLL